MTEARAAREGGIDVARAIACILLVFFHVVGGSPDDGLRFPPGSAWHEALAMFQPLRMPLFAFISGYVYAARPFRPGTERSFLLGKFKRLGLPLITVGSLFYAVEAIRDHRAAEAALIAWPQTMAHSYAIFWFLQAMLLIFASLILLERGPLRHFWGLIAVAALLAAAEPLVVGVRLFSIAGAVYLAPFFLLGLAQVRFRERFRWHPLPIALIAAAALALNGVTIAAGDEHRWWAQAARVIAGAAGAILIVKIARPNRFLQWIGRESFPIYLFHIFFVVAARIVALRIGLPIAIALPMGVLAGLFGPMLVAAALRRQPLLAQAMLGEGRRRAPPPAA